MNWSGMDYLRIFVWIIMDYCDYCDVQMFEHLFWRHPFTAEYPLASKWCNAKFLQIYSDTKTNSLTSWMAWEWVHFHQTLIFVWTISLTIHQSFGTVGVQMLTISKEYSTHINQITTYSIWNVKID